MAFAHPRTSTAHFVVTTDVYAEVSHTDQLNAENNDQLSADIEALENMIHQHNESIASKRGTPFTVGDININLKEV
tara:strand:+ start:613 stop:840 length:228 start_codon:yes stop_codon:yes gene_type:complete